MQFAFLFVVVLSTVVSNTRAEHNRQKRSILDLCNSCHSKLNECTRYPFMTEDDQKDISDWATCMRQPFNEWRLATGVDFWPDSKKLTTGPIGGFWYGRLECFDYMIGTPHCIACGISHLVAYQQLYRAGDACWDIIEPRRKGYVA